MTDQERVLFERLTKKRKVLANALDDPAARGIKSSVVEKYSDQAHFIYELLQNADDAHASVARFILRKDCLIFAHNGTRHFSISDVFTEEKDSQNNQLGDINAITSIGNSNKTSNATIGKFGVGFKAVFQYTSTPHIYDPEFSFKIDRFIVPLQLDEDHEERKPEETLFVFPFDHSERNANEAYGDISDKLKKLTHPLLFLSTLKLITYEFDGVHGVYSKRVKETRTFGDTIAELLCVSRSSGYESIDNDLWLFSRSDSSDHKYCVGFFLDRYGNLKPVDYPAFCFFPTKEVTRLRFIIHAPFLLTDSREGIRAGITHNEQMVSLLSDLAADALCYLRDIGISKAHRLIDDNILSIVPIDDEKFSKLSDKNRVSFLPFYTSIKTAFSTKKLLPTADGYTIKKNAYWASVPQIAKLFSDSQLGQITDNPDAHWVFVTKGRDDLKKTDGILSDYIDSLVYTNLNETVILNGRTQEYFYNRYTARREALVNVKGILNEFIETQPISWLHEFYKWLSETKTRLEIAKKKPVFLSQERKAVAAYNNKGQNILFLPVEGITGYTFILQDLLEDEETRAFIDQLGIKEPSLKDQIFNNIVPQYKKKGQDDIDHDLNFRLFFDYYCQCKKVEIDDFICQITDLPFLCYYTLSGNEQGYEKASSLYLPTEEMRAYFQSKRNTRFLDYNKYVQIIEQEHLVDLNSFFSELRVNKEIRIIKQEIEDPQKRKDIPHPRFTRYINWNETVIDGGKEIVSYIEIRHDRGRSLFLWDQLVKLIESHRTKWFQPSLSSLVRGTCSYFFKVEQTERFPSSDEAFFQKHKWLLTKEDEFVAPKSMRISQLSTEYDVSSEAAKELLVFLDIEPDTEIEVLQEDEDPNLTDDQRKKIALAEQLEQYGFGLSDVREFLLYKKQQQLMADDDIDTRSLASEISALRSVDKDDQGSEDAREESSVEDSRIPPKTRRVVKDIVSRTRDTLRGMHESETLTPDDPADEDEYTPVSVDYSKRIERAKQKSASEIDNIIYMEDLQNQAMNADRYSFLWFKTLLEMESANYGEISSNSKEVSISFGKVEKDPKTKRTLILKNPNRYIPQFMEDLADIPLVLHMADNRTKTVAIEVANIQSYTLRVKLKSHTEIDGVDLSSVVNATIDAKSPSFLLEELRNKFAALDYDDSFSMRDNLCRNIEFVFGPPGTGKTTHIAKHILLPMMASYKPCRVLVLTPTNKAADVIVRRIMELSGIDRSYENWLVRFGATGDETIEESPVFRDKTFDITSLQKSVTVTTIARFPYDFFMPQGRRIYLDGLNWDYIIIDEASMISLAYIVYPLYKKTPTKFIIAGDPFQIEPITSIDLWKNENIYTMVRLNSFVSPTTVPHSYKVELLTTQYRSVPVVGDVFSQLTYGGVLNHHRSQTSQKQIRTGNDFIMKSLNIIKFPVSKYESIYKPKRLQNKSTYQVYSALFTFEFINYLSKLFTDNNPEKRVSIGVIAPYRAQADLIDKLMASVKFPKQIDVQTGTIHGFQGDECDIIFAIFNTPPSISSSKEMFLNKQNIINVSVSRAKDYLFVVMPDDETENIGNLNLVKRVERIIKSSSDWIEYDSPSLERLMFGNEKYLEENAFSTSHQSVNVYGLPEMRYEIRTEDTAVDVQIHRGSGEQPNMSKESTEPQLIKDIESDDRKPHQEERDEILSEDKIFVSGRVHGVFTLVCYKGRLRKLLSNRAEPHFLVITINKKEKLINVSVDKKEEKIYISKELFNKYKDILLDLPVVPVRKTYLS